MKELGCWLYIVCPFRFEWRLRSPRLVLSTQGETFRRDLILAGGVEMTSRDFSEQRNDSQISLAGGVEMTSQDFSERRNDSQIFSWSRFAT